MATVFKSAQRRFEPNPNRIDSFRLLSDMSIIEKGLQTQNLNFDLRQLNPGQFSALYHFHRFAEELFMIISGEATLRTPAGLEVVGSGDLMFFESGDTGAHQLYNHAEEPCIFLDIRTFIGYDVCEYPDSNKIWLSPSREIFKKEATVDYFEGEKNIRDIWERLKNKTE